MRPTEGAAATLHPPAGEDACTLAALLPGLQEIPLVRATCAPPRRADPDRVPPVGAVSLVADPGAGQVVETATVGREGLVGSSVLPGTDAVTTIR